MTFTEHFDAIKKEMTSMNNQITQNKADLDRSRQEISSVQVQLQQVSSMDNNNQMQAELTKANELTKKLESLAKSFIQTISDHSQQAHLLAELETIAKNVVPQLPMMNAVAAAAAMQPHMMMRNPMLNAMSGASPRVGKGVPPNNGMNGMAMMQQMQMQMQAQAAQAMMHAQMFPGMPMMGVPGMMGLPPGMAGLPGMMPPNAATAAAMQQFTAQAQAAQAQMAAAAIAVSTPSRNPSTSGAASRTRTPLTASATNSPRPTIEAVIKEEDPPSMETDVPVTATTAIKQEENSTVAVA